MKFVIRYEHLVFATKVLAVTALDYTDDKNTLKRIDDISSELCELWGVWDTNNWNKSEQFVLSRLCRVAIDLGDFDNKKLAAEREVTKASNIKDFIGYANMISFTEIVLNTAFQYMEDTAELITLKKMMLDLFALWGIDSNTPQGTEESTLFRLVALIDAILEGSIPNQ